MERHKRGVEHPQMRNGFCTHRSHAGVLTPHMSSHVGVLTPRVRGSKGEYQWH